MKIWEQVRRFVPSFRSVALFIFVFGLGVIFAILSSPQIGAFLATVPLTLEAATGNWFPDRFDHSGVLRYDAARARPGYTLYTVAPDLSAHLIDMNGQEVHKWYVPAELAMPGSLRSIRTLYGLLEPQVEGGYLYPNGDLILVYEVKALGVPATPLVKLDKDSNIIWRTSVKSHHAVEIVGDRLYALTGTFIQPDASLPSNLRRAYMGEHVSVLDANGKALSSYPLLNAVANTPSMRLADLAPLDPRADLLHSNSVDVLTEQTAKFIPGAKPGNVLLSLRNLDMLVVMDLESDTIVWALRGSWRKQHDAKMLPNGHILLFDNEGNLMKHGRSRVLEIDPKTAGIVWSYDGTNDDPLDSGDNRGGAQRLSNGNTLINESDAGRLLEVTPDGSVVWEYVNPVHRDAHDTRFIASFGLTATRYDRSFVKFLGSERHHEATR